MNGSVKGKLVLKDGTVYAGTLFGGRCAAGETVFTTGMSGYQETLTDPSFCSQIVVMTYPLLGNYGCNPMFTQGERSFFAGYVVGELCEKPSNWRCEETLGEFLRKQDVPVLAGVDTRAITRKIRTQGVLPGVIVPEDADETEIARLMAASEAHDQVSRVSTREAYTCGKAGGLRVAVIDFGIKRNILTSLEIFGCETTVYPYDTPASVILEADPDGVFLSNGPGDPKDVPAAIETVRALIGKKPIFGICLGHQILALANGLETFKMKFGHRGFNHPVKDLVSGRIYISSQNHGYAVDEKSLAGKPVQVSHVSVNDDTIEGLVYLDQPSFAVQYHPEASPGPGGHDYLFERFVRMMEEN